MSSYIFQYVHPFYRFSSLYWLCISRTIIRIGYTITIYIGQLNLCPDTLHSLSGKSPVVMTVLKPLVLYSLNRLAQYVHESSESP